MLSSNIKNGDRGGEGEWRVVCILYVCVDLWVVVVLRTHLRTHLFFSLLSVCCRQGGSLIMFLVVFTNVSFIKRQQPREPHHPSAKVEVIIALNHLSVYLFGWLSQGEGGQPLLAPGESGCPSLVFCMSYSAILTLSHYSPLLFLSFPVTHLVYIVNAHFASFTGNSALENEKINLCWKDPIKQKTNFLDYCIISFYWKAERTFLMRIIPCLSIRANGCPWSASVLVCFVSESAL